MTLAPGWAWPEETDDEDIDDDVKSIVEDFEEEDGASDKETPNVPGEEEEEAAVEIVVELEVFPLVGEHLWAPLDGPKCDLLPEFRSVCPCKGDEDEDEREVLVLNSCRGSSCPRSLSVGLDRDDTEEPASKGVDGARPDDDTGDCVDLTRGGGYDRRCML